MTMQKGNAINVAQSRALADKLEQSSGFVTVTFVKKDGSVRKMNCRMGVSKYLKGGESTLDANQYVTVYDMTKAAYRAINRDTIIDIKGV
jgi:cell division protein FtsX